MKRQQEMSLQGRPAGRGNPAPVSFALGAEWAWMSQGACVGKDPDMWFAEEVYEPEVAKKAQKTCRSCVVQWNCLKYALDTGQEYGTFGGVEMSPGLLENEVKKARHLRRLEPKREAWTP